MKLLGLDIHGPGVTSVESIFPSSGAEPRSTVLIAARNGTHRRTLSQFLKERGHAVVTTDNEDDAITLAQTGDIDLVMTGHTMAGICGHDLTRKLREVLPRLPVLLVSAGMETLNGDFLDFVGTLAESTTPAAQTTGGDESSNSETSERLASLTQREKQVLDLVTAGHGNKAAARLLAISPRTVENHRARIMRKTRSRNLAELVHLSLLHRKGVRDTSRVAA